MLPTRSTFQYTPIAIAKGYDFLKELPLFQFYDKLKGISPVQYDGHPECKNLTAYDGLYKICNNIGDILGNIEQFSKLVDVDNNNNRSCQYLNYLIQEEIEKEECNSNTLPHLYEALTQYNRSYGNNECKFEENTNTNIDKRRKKLYYYTEYLYWIQKKFIKIQYTEKIKYYLFLNDCVSYYNMLLRDDTCNNSKKYKTELQKFKEKYDKALNAIKIRYSTIKPIPMNDKDSTKKLCPTGQQEDQNIFSSFSSNRFALRNNPPTAPPLPTHTVSASGDINNHGNPEDSNGSTIGKATTFICSGVAIFMSSFILHKVNKNFL